MQSDHLRRRDFIALVGGAAAAWPVSARAQQPPARIGFLGSTSAARFGSRIEAFRSGLRDLGYVEGKNIVIAFRWADEKYDQLPALAAELVRENVDVIVTTGRRERVRPSMQPRRFQSSSCISATPSPP